MGVDMLFIASGFVLFLPVVTNGTLGDMRSYARRRAARVVPAFYVFLAVSFFVAMIVSAPRGGAGAWVSHLLFLHAESHNAAEEVGFGVNGVLWTMSTEVMFYVALAGVARWYRRRPAAGLAIAVLIAQAWQLATVKLPEILRALGIDWAEVIEGQRRMALAFPTYTAHFAIGMTAAWLYVRFKERSVEPGRVIVFQLLVLAAIAFNVYQRVWEAKVAETAGPFDHHVRTIDRAFLFGCFILATALAPPAARWLFEAPLSRILGAVAYGTYLSHLPLIALLVASDGFSASTTDNGQLARLIAIVLPASVIMGIVSFRYLEEPFRRWARRARS